MIVHTQVHMMCTSATSNRRVISIVSHSGRSHLANKKRHAGANSSHFSLAFGASRKLDMSSSRLLPRNTQLMCSLVLSGRQDRYREVDVYNLLIHVYQCSFVNCHYTERHVGP